LANTVLGHVVGGVIQESGGLSERAKGKGFTRYPQDAVDPVKSVIRELAAGKQGG
jgi:hypothetical protein